MNTTQRTAIPTKITLKKEPSQLVLDYANGEQYVLSAEYLRVHSPSAEVRGHGQDQAVLQVGKRNVAISNITPSGNYALLLTFSDGHDTGIYSWEYLADLGLNHTKYWDAYLQKLHDANQSRDPDTQVVQFP